MKTKLKKATRHPPKLDHMSKSKFVLSKSGSKFLLKDAIFEAHQGLLQKTKAEG